MVKQRKDSAGVRTPYRALDVVAFSVIADPKDSHLAFENP